MLLDCFFVKINRTEDRVGTSFDIFTKAGDDIAMRNVFRIVHRFISNVSLCTVHNNRLSMAVIILLFDFVDAIVIKSICYTIVRITPQRYNYNLYRILRPCRASRII